MNRLSNPTSELNWLKVREMGLPELTRMTEQAMLLEYDDADVTAMAVYPDDRYTYVGPGHAVFM